MTTPFLKIFQMAAQHFDVPVDLLMGMAKQESNFNPKAVSSAGAQGIMQLMPPTARALGVDDPFDPVQNIIGGAAYLKEQLNAFGTTEEALAAYNAGPGRVRAAGGDFSKLPRETQNYVPAVLSHQKAFSTGSSEQPQGPSQRAFFSDLTAARASTNPSQFFSGLHAAKGPPQPPIPRKKPLQEPSFEDTLFGDLFGGGEGGFEAEGVEQPISPHPEPSARPFPVPQRTQTSARIRQVILEAMAKRRQRFAQRSG